MRSRLGLGFGVRRLGGESEGCRAAPLLASARAFCAANAFSIANVDEFLDVSFLGVSFLGVDLVFFAGDLERLRVISLADERAA